jgi:hypothetical protein
MSAGALVLLYETWNIEHVVLPYFTLKNLCKINPIFGDDKTQGKLE